MNKQSGLAALLALSFSVFSASAGSVDTSFVADEVKTPIDLLTLDGSYVFGSELTDGGRHFGDQEASELGFEYAHRFHLAGSWFLRTGVSYYRFDFGRTSAPVPDHLQALSAVISLDYMVGADRGAFLEIRPGFYGVDDLRSEAFDVPITLARAWVLKPKKIFFITGVNVAFLRGEFPVLPVVGLVWHINDNLLLNAVVPEPRLIYMPNKSLDLWVGGQLTGGSYRTEANDNIVPHKLSNAQLDYSDYRASAGLTYHATGALDLELGGGYSFERRFDFDRANQEYDTDPAPFVKLSLRAAF